MSAPPRLPRRPHDALPRPEYVRLLPARLPYETVGQPIRALRPDNLPGRLWLARQVLRRAFVLIAGPATSRAWPVGDCESSVRTARLAASRTARLATSGTSGSSTSRIARLATFWITGRTGKPGPPTRSAVRSPFHQLDDACGHLGRVRRGHRVAATQSRVGLAAISRCDAHDRHAAPVQPVRHDKIPFPDDTHGADPRLGRGQQFGRVGAAPFHGNCATHLGQCAHDLDLQLAADAQQYAHDGDPTST